MQQQLQTEEPKADIRELIKKLNSRDEVERKAASVTVQAMGSERLEEFLIVLAQANRRRKRTQRGVAIAFLSIFAMMFLVAIVAHDWHMFGSIGGMTGLLGACAAATATEKNVTKELAQFDDLRIVGPLAKALDYGDKQLRQIAENRLIVMLPRLKASDAALLDAEQRAPLYRALSGKNEPLILAILKAFEQIGDRDMASDFL